MMQEMAKIEAMDRLFMDDGVNEHDIVIAFQKYDLLESDEFKQIMMQTQQKMQATIQQAMQQMQ